VSRPPLAGRLEPELPLPPYRYLPGRAPHPFRHADGHHHFHPDPLPDPLFDPARPWTEDRRYRHGLDLYAAGFWWEAHELWEAIWRVVPRERPERELLQALIQSAACRVKWALGGLRAARHLRGRVRVRFERVRTACGSTLWGIDLDAWEHELDALLTRPPPVP
jgi:hypothetical protein